MCKVGAFVVAYCGAEFLDRAIPMMSRHLRWFWLYNIRHNGGYPIMHNKNIEVTSKPVIAYTNGYVDSAKVQRSHVDFLNDAPEKGLHPWQQGIAFPAWQIVLRTQPGELVLDPFMGSGNILAAAVTMGRHVIGIDIEQKWCDVAIARLEKML